MRLIGDAAVAAFFSHAKDKARKEAAKELAGLAGSADWEGLRTRAATLGAGEHPIRPFHWEAEFPEVFGRENPGFDAIMGNPPFAGKNTLISGAREFYLEWLQMLHIGAHGNADLVAHFFNRAFALLRADGRFGFIATNTIGQGDTRETGLTTILRRGGTVEHAIRRLKWPGEAAVVVSVVHLMKGICGQPTLNSLPVPRVSSYLVDGYLDESPFKLAANKTGSYQGSILLGLGFLFSDGKSTEDKASSIAKMIEILSSNPRNASVIRPYIGGEEVANSPSHNHSRYCIDFRDYPLRRDARLVSWISSSPAQQKVYLSDGIVPHDYPRNTSDEWPELPEIVERSVRPERLKQNDEVAKRIWWRFLRRRDELYSRASDLKRILATSRVASHSAMTFVPTDIVYSLDLILFPFEGSAALSALQSRVHEVWARFFASTLEDRLRYTPSDCFETFPLPLEFETSPALEAVGEAYHGHRAALMVARNQGMTPTYNRFHDPADEDADIVDLRRLHAEMDVAVLAAYGWDDLAATAAPVFLTEDTEDEYKYQGRLFWPAPFRDEVLARLLKENERRAALEKVGLPGESPAVRAAE